MLLWFGLLDFLGLYNSSVEKKLCFIKNRWFLGRMNSNKKLGFKNYISNYINKTEKRLNR